MLTELSNKYKREIMASLEPVKENLGTIDNAMGRLQMCHDDIADQCAAIGVSIEGAIQQIHTALDTRKAELMNQLQMITIKNWRLSSTKLTGLKQCVHTLNNVKPVWRTDSKQIEKKKSWVLKMR